MLRKQLEMHSNEFDKATIQLRSTYPNLTSIPRKLVGQRQITDNGSMTGSKRKSRTPCCIQINPLAPLLSFAKHPPKSTGGYGSATPRREANHPSKTPLLRIQMRCKSTHQHKNFSSQEPAKRQKPTSPSSCKANASGVGLRTIQRRTATTNTTCAITVAKPATGAPSALANSWELQRKLVLQLLRIVPIQVERLKLQHQPLPLIPLWPKIVRHKQTYWPA
jgi:hypothetical protein